MEHCLPPRNNQEQHQNIYAKGNRYRFPHTCKPSHKELTESHHTLAASLDMGWARAQGGKFRVLFSLWCSVLCNTTGVHCAFPAEIKAQPPPAGSRISQNPTFALQLLVFQSSPTDYNIKVPCTYKAYDAGRIFTPRTHYAHPLLKN